MNRLKQIKMARQIITLIIFAMEYFQLLYPGGFPYPSFLIPFCIKACTYAHVLESLIKFQARLKNY